MSQIEDIVNIQIALNTSTITKRDFSTLMILVPGAWAFRVGQIGDADELLVAPYSLSPTSPGYLAAQDAFSQIPTLTKLYIGRVDSADSTPAITMVAINGENNRFYAFMEAARTTAKTVAYAAWAEANKKLFFVGVTGDDGPQGTLTDVAGLLKTANYFRSVPIHYNNAGDYPEAAWPAKALSFLPGSDPWANAELAAIQSANLSATQKANILFRNSNTYELYRDDLSMTQNGKVSAGEWIDVIRGRDFMEEECKTRIFNLFPNRKIPFTDAGIRTIKSGLHSALDYCQRIGIIMPDDTDARGNVVPGFTINVPLARDISVGDKASRVLKDVTFNAYLAGAIHAVQVRGAVSYYGA